LKLSHHLWRAQLYTALEVAPAEVSERRVYAAAAIRKLGHHPTGLILADLVVPV
jgi:hypothetical protein